MGEATFTFRVDDELKAAFSEAAKGEDRTGAQLLRGFMREYVEKRRDAEEYDKWFRRQVEIGLEYARRGEGIPSDEVEAHFARRRAEGRRKRAASGR